MPTTTDNYDSNGRVTSRFYEDGSRTLYNWDQLGNRIAVYEVPPCECYTLKFIILTQFGNFAVSDGPGVYYRVVATATATLPPSPADGGVYKFKAVSGVTTLVADGSETINRANGSAVSSLLLRAGRGVLELVAVDGGWDET